MDYQEFIEIWIETLQALRFPNLHLANSHETIDIRSMDRTYRTYLWWPDTPETKLFTVTADISWIWHAVLSARYATTEEDMLMQIYGDFGIHEDTEPPWLRIDLTMHATLPYDYHYPLPLLDNWQTWVEKVSLDLEPFLPGEIATQERNLLMLAWHGTPEAEITFDAQGHAFLEGVRLKSWQGINLPRKWDDPDKKDPDPSEQLCQFVTMLLQALGIWQSSLVQLLDRQGL